MASRLNHRSDTTVAIKARGRRAGIHNGLDSCVTWNGAMNGRQERCQGREARGEQPSVLTKLIASCA